MLLLKQQDDDGTIIDVKPVDMWEEKASIGDKHWHVMDFFWFIIDLVDEACSDEKSSCYMSLPDHLQIKDNK